MRGKRLGLVALQISFWLLLLANCPLFVSLHNLHDWWPWPWTAIVVAMVVGVLGVALSLHFGIQSWKDPRLQKWVVDGCLTKPWRMIILTLVLVLVAGVQIWLIAPFFGVIHDSISFEKFIAELNVKRAEHPAAVREFVKDYEGKRVVWDCVILRIERMDKVYALGLTAEAEVKDQADAWFSDSGGFKPSLLVGDKVRIEGTIHLVNDSGIMLRDCEFAEK